MRGACVSRHVFTGLGANSYVAETGASPLSLEHCCYRRATAGPQVSKQTLLLSSCYGKEVVLQAPWRRRAWGPWQDMRGRPLASSSFHVSPMADFRFELAPWQVASLHMHASPPERCSHVAQTPAQQAPRLPRHLRPRLEQAGMRHMCDTQLCANVPVCKAEHSP